MSITVRPLSEGDFFSWLSLYEAYGKSYETPITDQNALLVWSWLTSETHELFGLVAANNIDGTLVGFAHYRVFSRTLEGDRGLYLEDLYETPDARNHDTDRALIEGVKQIATDHQLGIVRWITESNNKGALKLYDSVASRTDWVTYELLP